MIIITEGAVKITLWFVKVNVKYCVKIEENFFKVIIEGHQALAINVVDLIRLIKKGGGLNGV